MKKEGKSAANVRLPFKLLRRNARVRLVQILYAWMFQKEVEGDFYHQVVALIEREENEETLSYDVAYFHKLFKAWQQHDQAIHLFLSKLIDRDLSKVGKLELSVLKLACLEMSTQIQVPEKVAINEAIELAKAFGATESFKFINGVLRLASDAAPILFNAPSSQPPFST